MAPVHWRRTTTPASFEIDTSMFAGEEGRRERESVGAGGAVTKVS
jgi:hypothetical protein